MKKITMYVEDIPDNSPIAIPPGVRSKTFVTDDNFNKKLPDIPIVPIEWVPAEYQSFPIQVSKPQTPIMEEHDDDEIAQYVQTSKTHPVSIDEVLVSADGIIVDGRFIPIGVLGEAAKAGCMLTKMENNCNCHHE